MTSTPSPNHSVVGADKISGSDIYASHPDGAYTYKCHSRCKCFTKEFLSKHIGKIYHKLCCYVFTVDGKLWMGYYDSNTNDIDDDERMSWPTPDHIWCCVF